MNLIELLQGHLDQNLIGQLTNHIGADSPAQTESAASGIISTLMAQLSKNASTPEGATSLVNALDRDHDGSILNDVSGYLMGDKQTDNSSTLDGAGILGHILGGNQSNIAAMLGKMTGLDQSQIGKLMISLAPMVLAAIGKTKNQEGLDSSNIGDLLSGTVKSQVNEHQEMDLLHRFLDADGDGSVMDDLANIGMKFFSRK